MKQYNLTIPKLAKAWENLQQQDKDQYDKKAVTQFLSPPRWCA